MFVTRSGVKRKTKTNCPWINLDSWSVLFMHSRRRRGLGKSLSGGRRRPAAPSHPLAPWDRDNHRQATFFFSGTGRHSPLHQSPLRHRQPGPPEHSVHDYKVQTGQQGPPEHSRFLLDFTTSSWATGERGLNFVNSFTAHWYELAVNNRLFVRVVFNDFFHPIIMWHDTKYHY